MKLKLILANIVAIIIVVAIVGFGVQVPSRAADAPAARIVAVTSGTVVSAVNASGTVEAGRESALAFRVDGYIEQVLVKAGQQVSAGDVLAVLDSGDLELALKSAQIDVRKAQASLSALQTSADSAEVASAQAALAKAQAAYDGLVQEDTTDEVTVAAADLRTAEIAVQKAQGDYDQVSWRGDVAASAEAQALEEATIAYEKAKSEYNIANGGPTDEELKAAEADIASAKAALATLLAGTSEAELAVSQAEVEAAQVAVEIAERNLEQARLVAPFDGTVTEVLTDAGQRATETTSVLTLSDLSALQVSVPVDEIDVTDLQVGQPVSVTLDALGADRPLAGQVAEVAPSPDESSDDTTAYEVKVALADPYTAVRVGMNGKVEIETARREGAPMVAATAIRTDDAGQAYVEVLQADGSTVKTPVTLGSRSGQLMEVVDGLSVGQEVTEPSQSATVGASAATTASSGSGGSPMMMLGGGGPPPGE